LVSVAYDGPYPDEDEIPPALGTVVEQDRGALPFALIHGEAAVACAAWALGQAGVTPVDAVVPWEALVEAGEPYVLHDALCPMTPPEFIAACVERATEHACVVVGVRPVTDTVKQVADGLVGATVDRGSLVAVASPVVLPPDVVAALDGLPSSDFVTLIEGLRRRFPVELVEAPPGARRVGSVDDLRVLEALTAPR
jgi:2-C-methyl-D-erythritol 4-phosphate cytidylyltransferase